MSKDYDKGFLEGSEAQEEADQNLCAEHIIKPYQAQIKELIAGIDKVNNIGVELRRENERLRGVVEEGLIDVGTLKNLIHRLSLHEIVDGNNTRPVNCKCGFCLAETIS